MREQMTMDMSKVKVEESIPSEDTEAVRSDGYKIIAVEDCGCPCEAFQGLYSVVDGETRCSLCGKKIKLMEIFVLNGCPKCTPAKLKELDDTEKEVYNL